MNKKTILGIALNLTGYGLMMAVIEILYIRDCRKLDQSRAQDIDESETVIDSTKD